MESTDASAPATCEGAHDCSQTPRSRRVPLNSRQLTAAQLWQLDLPTSDSADNVRQLIQRKLADRDAQNVQVTVDETPRMKTIVWLVDSEGPFLQTAPGYWTLLDLVNWTRNVKSCETRMVSSTSDLRIYNAGQRSRASGGSA